MPDGKVFSLISSLPSSLSADEPSVFVRAIHRCRVGGGTLSRWPPSAAQTAVDLSKHLGHKVTVTGTFKAESYESKEKEENEKKERGPEAGDIRVTSLKMVSDSCK